MTLRPNQSIGAAGGRAVLTYQGDGNLVLYHDGSPVWASMAFTDRPGVCQFQDDGNIVCYDTDGRPYWASGTDGHWGARLVLQDDGNLVIYALDGTPMWATHTLLPPPSAKSYDIYGNFLANGFEPWGFMAPSWWQHDRARWARFVTAYAAAGYRHLPFALYGDYWGEPAFDLRDPQQARDVVQIHLDQGITPIIMAITDDFVGAAATDPNEAWRRVEPAIRRIADLPVTWCCGWEINQVAAFRSDRQGHDLITLCQRIQSVTGQAPWLHLQPNWWGPHYADGDEDRWWRDVGDACQGLFLQLPWNQPLDEGWHLAAVYPRASDGARGIVGRLAALGKRCVLFEYARNLPRWQRGEALVRADGRFVGVC